MASLINDLIGEYRLIEPLGAGGMGEVYKAVHVHLGRVIAVKVLSPDLADGPGLQRFYSEANIQASLRHPGVAEYLGFYEHRGRPCILMEYVDGQTLAALVRDRGPLPPAEAAGIMRGIAAVVAHFHSHGVVHRDLKAGNVKIDSQGRIKILDFGIARHQRADRLTRAGAVIGTPATLAPEQIRGEPATQATDVWQLGIMFYELLTGRLPFDANTTHELYAHILSAEFPAIAPSDLNRIVARCLEKNPARRYPDAAALGAALVEPVPAGLFSRAAFGRWRTPLLLFIGLLCIALGVFQLVTTPETPGEPTPIAASNPAQGEIKNILIDTAGGTAQVFREGKLIGATPFQVHARAGEPVNLLLKRDGFDDMPVQFDAGERGTYTFNLEPRKGP